MSSRLKKFFWNGQFNEAKAHIVTYPQVAQFRDPRGHGSIWQLCYWDKTDNVDMYQYLKQHGATLGLEHAGTCSSPLHRAAQRGNYEITCALIGDGVPVNVFADKRDTPLDWIVNYAYNGDANVIKIGKMLLDLGATFGPGSMSVMPQWATNHLAERAAQRERIALVTVTLMGVPRCYIKPNGLNGSKDVFRVIARCVWSTRKQYNCWK